LGSIRHGTEFAVSALERDLSAGGRLISTSEVHQGSEQIIERKGDDILLRCPLCNGMFVLKSSELGGEPAKDVTADAVSGKEGTTFSDFREKVLHRILQKEFELPLLPHVAIKVMRLANDADTSVQELARVVLTDQAIAARVLQVANSAAYNFSVPVKNMTQAINRLGLLELRNIILSISLQTKVFRSSLYAKRAKLLWENSLGSAFGSRILARTLGRDQEMAFLAGLLHRIGEMVLLSVLEKAVKDFKSGFVPPESFVEEILNQYGGDVGDLVSHKWELPETIKETILAINRRQLADDSNTLAAVVAVADRMCQGIGLGSEAVDVDWNIEPLARKLRLDEVQMADLCDQLEQIMCKAFTELN